MKTNNKLYYITIVLQFILLLYFAFCKECTNKYKYYNYKDKLQDYKECSRKLDSVFLERRNNNKCQNTLTTDASVRCLKKYDNYTVYNKNINFIDTVKVSYPGKDGVIITKYYPLHKTIID